MLKSIAALALAATTAFAPVAAQARNSTFQDHIDLAHAIMNTGVEFQVNPPACFGEDAPMGWYAGQARTLVVCQDNAVDQEQVTWTENDLDTLRHEAQHMIQDCMIGDNHDHLLAPVYRKPLDLAANTLSQEHIGWIIESYRERGASDHVLVLELEAFSVAAIDNPQEQIADIKHYCW